MFETVSFEWLEGEGRVLGLGAGWGCVCLCPPALPPCCFTLTTQPPCLWLCPLQVPPPSPEPSSMTRQFQPPQRMQQTNVSLLGQETVGNKVRPGVPSRHPQIPTFSELTSPHSLSLLSHAGAHRVQP